jgi:hypothetical protein
MGQKSLDSFFKKPAAAAKAMSSSAAANEAAAAEPAPAEQPAAGAAAAAGGSGGDGAAAAATAAPADVHAAQAAEQQQLRVHANRNGALAKQVTCGCAAAGQLPALPRLVLPHVLQLPLLHSKLHQQADKGPPAVHAFPAAGGAQG